MRGGTVGAAAVRPHLACPVFFLLAGCAGAAQTPADAPGPGAAGEATPSTATAPAGPASPAKELLVLMPVRLRGAALFPEETEVLRRAERDFFASRPEVGKDKMVPLDQVRAVEAAARGGRARIGGPVCAAAPALDDALFDAFPGMPEARAVASCDAANTCSLHVSVVRPSGGARADTLAVFEAPVSAPGAASDWQAAVAHLAFSRQRGGTLAAAPAAGGDDRVTVTAVHAFGPWASAPAPAVFAPARDALDACHDPDAAHLTTPEAVLAVGADGHVGRCQSDARLGADCFCKALASVALPAGPDGRRLAVDLWSAPAPLLRTAAGLTMSARLEEVRAEDGTTMTGAIAPWTSRLAVCRALDPQAGTMTARLHLSVDAQGHVQSARATGLGAAMKACVEVNAKRIALPCPRGGLPTSVTATLLLDASR